MTECDDFECDGDNKLLLSFLNEVELCVCCEFNCNLVHCLDARVLLFDGVGIDGIEFMESADDFELLLLSLSVCEFRYGVY